VKEIDALVRGVTMLGIVKWMVVIFLLVYNVFAFLMMRQTKVMTKAVSMRDDYLVRIFSIAHFVFAGLTLLLSILIL